MSDALHRFDDFELNWNTRQLFRHGEPVAVEPKALELIRYLLLHRERAVGKDELAEELWPGRIVSDTVISQTVRKARAAVADDGERQAVIATVRGFGYRFVAEASVPGTNRAAPAGQVPGRTRTVRNLALAGSLVLLVAALVLFIDRPAHGPATMVVAISPSIGLPNDMDSGSDSHPHWLASAIPDVLATWLNLSDRLMVLPPSAVAAQLTADDHPDLAHARLFEFTGADQLIVSELFDEGDQWRLEVQLIDVTGSAVLLTERGDEPLALAMRIGRHLLNRWAPDYRHSSDAVLSDPWLAETFYRGVHAIRHVGDPAHALSLFETVIDYAPGFDRARYEMAVAQRQMGQTEAASEVFRALIEADQLSDERLRRMAANALAVSYWHAGELNQARPLFERFAQEGRAAGHRLDQAYGLLNMGMVDGNLGDLQQAESNLIEAMQIFSSLGYEAGRATAANSLGFLAWRRGDPDGSALWHRSALEIRQRLGNQRDIAQSLYNLGSVAASRLDWEESERLFQQARVIQEALGNQRQAAQILANMSQNRAQRGQIRHGLRLMNQALAEARETRSASLEADILARLGGLKLQVGDAPAALAHFGQALEVLNELDAPAELGTVLLGQATALRQLDQPERARERLDEAARQLETIEAPSAQLHWLKEAGEIALVEGDDQAAEMYWLDAFDQAAAARNLRRMTDIADSLIRLYLDRNQTERATEMLASLPEPIRDEGPLLILQAELAWLDGGTQQAVNVMEQASKTMGERWQARHQDRLNAFREAGKGPEDQRN